MSRYVTILLLALLIVPVMSIAEDCEGSCPDGVKLFGDFRYRAEADGRDFNADTDMGTYSSLRARFGVKFKADDMMAFLQMQYPHAMGWNASALGTDNNIDIHQAYLFITNLMLEGLVMQAGRFEMSYGDERLIGPVGWSNVGRTFDGVAFGYYMKDKFWADLFVTKLNERSAGSVAAKDDLFIGLWGALPSLNNLNFFLLHNRNVGLAGTDWKTSLSRNTVGIHYKAKYDMGFKTVVDFAYQMGKTYPVPGDDDSSIDIAAMMVLVGAWYKLDLGMDAWVGAGMDMTTGDDPTTADKMEAFDNMYYTGHKYRGYMDYFVGSGGPTNSGLTDIFVNFSLKSPAPFCYDTKIKLAFHMFTASQDYASMVDGADATAIGNEINIVRSQKLKENLTFDMGLGYFMPAEEFVGADKDASMWMFLQLQTKFDAQLGSK